MEGFSFSSISSLFYLISWTRRNEKSDPPGGKICAIAKGITNWNPGGPRFNLSYRDMAIGEVLKKVQKRSIFG